MIVPNRCPENPSMNIQEFLQLSSGLWLSQRTRHRFTEEQTDIDKADLWVDPLAGDDPKVIALCDQLQTPVNQAVGGLEVTWKATLGNGKTQLGSSVLVAIASETDPITGQWLSQTKSQPLRVGQYCLDHDEVMILRYDQDSTTIEERIWFPSENLRLRSTTLSTAGEPSSANFCSEIRRMGDHPKPSQADLEQAEMPAWRRRYLDALAQQQSSSEATAG
jgi:hypothetical protein